MNVFLQRKPLIVFFFFASLAMTVRAANPFAPPHFPLPKFPARTVSVSRFGALGAGQTNETPAINRAIAKCSAEGGGVVFFPAGKYLAASIHLRSNVELLLASNAVIIGAPDGFDAPEPNPFSKYQDFGHSHFHDALMWGENITNFAIVGGKIDGGSIGHGRPKPGHGDKLIAIASGKNLLFQNVTHEKGGHFVYLLNNCENVTLDHVVIQESRDAVDLMSCRDVQIHDCRFTGCADDTIGVKSDYALGRKIESANIYVWDSYFESGCNGLQFGSETAGDFYNVNFWNIRIGRAMKAGIGITCNDGGVIDDVNYSNIVIRGAASPIFMLITDRLRSGDPNKKIGTIKNVTVDDVTVTDCRPGRQGPVFPCTISGRPESSLKNITLENITIDYPGPGPGEKAGIVPPYPRDYSPRSMGPRPASGLYVRHVNGLTLKNVTFTFDRPVHCPPIVADDVNGLTLDNFKSPKSTDGQVMQLENVKKLTVENSPGLKDQKSTVVRLGGE
jgi:Glycosyl hydrolases family 28